MRTWRNSRHPPLAALAPESTIYVCGLSKNVASGLRFGFVALPTRFIEAFERAIHATTRNTPALMTAIATGWLNDGTVAGLETEKRVDARRRQTLARNVLDGFDTPSDIRRRTSCHCPCPRRPEGTRWQRR